jgi:hypothetical protein
VQAHATVGVVSAAASLTTGTLSNPLFTDDNSGRQFAARVEVRPVAGLVAGTSFARGPFVGQSAARAAIGEGRATEFTQQAWGGDLEYSRDYYLLRFETVVSGWRLPIVRAPVLTERLGAVATSFEGRYRLRPDLYAAARVDHLGFSDIVGTQETAPWDAPVTRFEIGAGFSIQRNLLLKLSYQHNDRNGGALQRTAQMTSAQLVFWF